MKGSSRLGGGAVVSRSCHGPIRVGTGFDPSSFAFAASLFLGGRPGKPIAIGVHAMGQRRIGTLGGDIEAKSVL